MILCFCQIIINIFILPVLWRLENSRFQAWNPLISLEYKWFVFLLINGFRLWSQSLYPSSLVNLIAEITPYTWYFYDDVMPWKCVIMYPWKKFSWHQWTFAVYFYPFGKHFILTYFMNIHRQVMHFLWDFQLCPLHKLLAGRDSLHQGGACFSGHWVAISNWGAHFSGHWVATSMYIPEDIKVKWRKPRIKIFPTLSIFVL